MGWDVESEEGRRFFLPQDQQPNMDRCGGLEWCRISFKIDTTTLAAQLDESSRKGDSVIYFEPSNDGGVVPDTKGNARLIRNATKARSRAFTCSAGIAVHQNLAI